MGKPFRVDAYPVIPHMESQGILIRGQKTVYGMCALGMADRVFQKVDDYLLDEKRIHGNHIKFIRKGYVDLRVRNPFFQALDGL